jgi:ubiquinol-cytochrome c reductase cytochrome b subunit
LNSLRRIVQKFIMYFRSYNGINNMWGYGSTTAVYIVLQVLTRLLLSMYVVMLVNISFDVVELLMENNVGIHYVRFLHANICSVVFIVLLIHASKGFWFGSYVKGNLWKSRGLLLVLVMRAAFLRYVLPWGNMSLWGATVITNLLSVLPKGDLILLNVWAGFTICNATLRRMFSLHFLVPLLVIRIILVHLILLHEYTSSSSNTVNLSMIEFSLLLNKDVILWIMWMMWLGIMIVLPQFFIDADNWGEANFLVTPDHIKPEWYFLFAYAILRCIPNKAIGVLRLVGSLVVVILMGFMNLVNFVTIFLVSFWILTW